MRRVVPIAVLAGALLFGLAPRALAADTVTSGPWTGSTLASTPCTHSFCGLFQRTSTLGSQYDIMVTLNFEELTAVPCDNPTRIVREGSQVDGKVSFDHDFPCNGTYMVTGSAVGESGFGSSSSPGITKQVAVSNPAPVVTDLTATPSTDGRTMTLVWSDMRAVAPDLSGYAIERKIDDGEFELLTRLTPDINVFDDTSLPDADGDAAYRITTARPDATGEQLYSPASAEAVAPFASTPPTTGPGGDGGADGGDAGDGGDGGGGADGGPGTTIGGSPGTTTPGGTGTGRRISAPRLGITGTFLPPLLKPSTVVVTTPTTVDSGYDENLPYDPQTEEPELPDEELAAEFGDEVGGRGMAIPVATGMLMAVWAFHLRFLARAGRPVD